VKQGQSARNDPARAGLVATPPTPTLPSRHPGAARASARERESAGTQARFGWLGDCCASPPRFNCIGERSAKRLGPALRRDDASGVARPRLLPKQTRLSWLGARGVSPPRLAWFRGAIVSYGSTFGFHASARSAAPPRRVNRSKHIEAEQESRFGRGASREARQFNPKRSCSTAGDWR
jgi:hypothetical protein